MKKRFFTLIAAIHMLSVPVYAVPSFEWQRVADNLTPRRLLGATYLDGKVYHVTGETGSHYGFSRDVLSYDPITDQYVTLAYAPTQRSRNAVVALNGQIWSICGVIPPTETVSLVEVYDPTSNIWTGPGDGVPQPKDARHDAGAVAVGGKIYVIGGGPYSMEVYDPAISSWEYGPTPAYTSILKACSAAVLGDRYIYIIHYPSQRAGEVDIFDTKLETWSLGPAISHPLLGTGGFSLHLFNLSGELYALSDTPYTLQDPYLFWLDQVLGQWVELGQVPELAGKAAFVAVPIGSNQVFITAGEYRPSMPSVEPTAWVGTVVPANQPPVANAGPDQIVECACQNVTGTQVTLDSTESYDPDNDPLIYEWSGPFVESPTNLPNPTVTLDGCVGEYEITLRVYDGQVFSVADTMTVMVVDTTPPIIICPEPITVEAQSASGVPETDPEILMFLTGASASDNCDPSPEITDDAPVEFPLGDTIVTFSATDAWTNTSSCQSTVTVEDTTPPYITILAPEPYELYPAGGLELDFSAYDLVSGNIEPPALWGTLEDAAGYSETVYPGDVPGAGVYTLVVSAIDQAGNEATSEPVFFVIYDSEGGFVTGGGWIDSPEGAYMPNLSLAGKAVFGFVSKYKKGSTVPTGNTEFVFKAGDLNFHSSSYDWLVVTGSDYARFKGWGSINGDDGFRFMLWAGDGAPDIFRIRIWWEDGEIENVVYDNGMDQPIEGGSIVVHTK